MRRTTVVNLVSAGLLLIALGLPLAYLNLHLFSASEPARDFPLSAVEDLDDKEPPGIEAVTYDSVAAYFKAGNPNATTYRLGEHPIQRKSFSVKQRNIIHAENGGVCQVCGSAGPLELEHRRALMNGGGNEREPWVIVRILP